MAEQNLLPLRTRRTVLRAFTVADAPALAAYRDDAAVARFQDWHLPFTIDDARALIDGQAGRPGPTPETWFQIAIEHEGEVAGDVAVGLDETGKLAMIGYTLRADRQGAGLATEAVEALVDRLFEASVHRIAATLDPENIASARLLERLGFRYEGRGVKAAWVRGEWLDDDRYALLRSDREAWLARPTDPPTEVTFVEVTPHNIEDVWRLATHRSQERFVATMPESFTDALVPEIVDGAHVVPWYRAVAADGVLAGFVMLAEPTEVHPHPYLWRLLVDRRHQRRGIGERVMRLVIARALDQGATSLTTSWVEGPGSPEPFYRRLGFEPTGEIDDGETVAALDLTSFR